MSREPGNIHDEPRFDALRLQGVGRHEAVTVANSDKPAGTLARHYEDWPLEALRRRAEQLAVKDAWSLGREELLRRLHDI